MNIITASPDYASSIIPSEGKAEELDHSINDDKNILSINRDEAENIHNENVVLQHQQAIMKSIDLDLDLLITKEKN